MSKSASDILFSILGATAAGVTVFFIDRHLAAKQTAPTPTPDNLGVDNSFTQAFQAQVSALGLGQGSATPVTSNTPSHSSSDCGCGGMSTPTPTKPLSLAQQSIQDSMNNLASLENAATLFTNRTITTNLGY